MDQTDGVADAVASEAYHAGRRAAMGSMSPSLNPHEPGTAEHVQWDQGYQSGQQQVAAYANQKARKEWWADRADFDSDWLQRGRAW